jgi:hypothetical protein
MRVGEWMYRSMYSLPRQYLEENGQLHFSAAERAIGTHWIGGWVGPRTDLDDVEKRKSCPHQNSNSDPSAFQPVASRYTDLSSAVSLQLATPVDSE